jgi:undecaprenyl diphosphate synthase
VLQHLACIMDGNRRWAKQRGLISWQGHKHGLDAAYRVVDFCLEKQIAYLSLYTFSTENLKRSAQERSFLFDFLAPQAMSEIIALKNKGVRVQFVGDRLLFPPSIVPLCNQIEKETAEGKKLQLNLLFCYGGRQEIVAGIKNIFQKIKAGLLTEQDISDEVLEQHLWTKNTPPPDIIVRTGGMHRLSNFLLFQGAYSELYFLDCMWPDVQHSDLEKIISYFDHCQRNFGL